MSPTSIKTCCVLKSRQYDRKQAWPITRVSFSIGADHALSVAVASRFAPVALQSLLQKSAPSVMKCSCELRTFLVAFRYSEVTQLNELSGRSMPDLPFIAASSDLNDASVLVPGRPKAQTPTRAPVSLPQTVRTTVSLMSKETLEIVLVSDLPSAATVIVRVSRCWPAGVPSGK